MSRVTWEWLAGFTQGDGCLYMPSLDSEKANHPSQLRITWYQTESDVEVLENIEKFLNKHELEVKWYLHNGNGVGLAGRPCWHLQLCGSTNVERVLKEIKPFLHGRKKEKANAMQKRLTKLPRGRTYVRKKVCKHGHDFTNPDNYYLRADGSKQCRLCARILDRRRYNAKKKAVMTYV